MIGSASGSCPAEWCKSGGNYRTGSFLTVATLPENHGPFETAEVGTAGNVAVEIAQMSFVDRR